jgi:ATP-dependent Clp protease adaptor protein ClpS
MEVPGNPADVRMADELNWRAVVARIAGAGGGDDGDGDGAGDDAVGGRGAQGGLATQRRTRTKTKTARPPMFKVILLNDDYTPMEFVVEVLKAVFHKPHAEATRIMLHVHQNGLGVAGVYPYEIADTKVRAVEDLARQAEYPLKCTLEKE